MMSYFWIVNTGFLICFAASLTAKVLVMRALLETYGYGNLKVFVQRRKDAFYRIRFELTTLGVTFAIYLSLFYLISESHLTVGDVFQTHPYATTYSLTALLGLIVHIFVEQWAQVRSIPAIIEGLRNYFRAEELISLAESVNIKTGSPIVDGIVGFGKSWGLPMVRKVKEAHTDNKILDTLPPTLYNWLIEILFRISILLSAIYILLLSQS